MNTIMTMDTFAQCMSVRSRINNGEIELTELTEIFEIVVSNKEAIIADISKTHNLKKLNAIFMNRYRGEKKAYLCKRLYEDVIIQSFNILDVHLSWMMFSEEAPKIENVVRDSFKDMTQKDLIERAEKFDKRRKVEEQRQKQLVQAVTDPKTYSDFLTWFRCKNEGEKLTTEQAELWDKLQADKKLEDDSKETERMAKIKAPVALDTAARIVETVHTQKGHDLYVVVLTEHVGKEAFKDLCIKCKQLGGYYSRYSRDGAVPGFQFTDNESAERFMALVTGEDQSKSDKQQDDNLTATEKTAAKLLKMAEKMEQDGHDALNADRQTNTHKRAREAGYAEETARVNIKLAGTIQQIANALQAGELTYLTEIKHKKDIELLTDLIRGGMYTRIRVENKRYAEENKEVEYRDCAHVTFPDIILNQSDKERLIHELEKCNGTTMLIKRVYKVFRENSRKQKLTFTMHEGSLMRKVIAKLKQNPLEVGYCMGLTDKAARIMQLQRLGIETSAQLRTALREFYSFLGAGPKVDKVKEMERDLVGRKIDGFFPTPKNIIDIMINEITVGTREGLNQNDKVLEPSAGKGDIAIALAELYPNVSVIECNHRLREILTAKGLNIVDHDFMDHNEKYDKIVMNPPFENGKDIEHVMHAYNCLNSGGRIVAIMAGGATWTSEQSKFVTFREWLSDKGHSEQLPEGSFKSSFRSTAVSTRIVVIDK